MKIDENARYDKVINEIMQQVYRFYQKSGRKDLVMVYNMSKKLLYSYIYSDFQKTLNNNSIAILKEQYEKAMTEGKIVLFIQDDKMKKYKSFVV